MFNKEYSSPFKGKSVLVVDPLENMRVTISGMLFDLGFTEILQAKDGIEADNLLRSRKINMVISEYHLPKLDGIKLLRKVRLDKKLANIPFVMVSATIEQSEVVRAIRFGVSEYVVKPFSINMLHQRLKSAVENPIKAAFALQGTKKSQTTTGDKVKQKRTLLIVDDVVDNIQIISDSLRENYKVKAATSGAKAIKLCLSESPPDLVLLDIMMPDIDGIEVCKRLKKSPVTQHIPIIFITSLTQTENVVEGLNVGAVDYITKPINPQILKARVDTHCKLLLANQSIREQVDTMIENVHLRDEFDLIFQNDLRTPLSELNAAVDTVERKHHHPDMVLQAVKTIRHSSTRLSQQIDNFLSLYKIEDGSYLYQPVTLNLSEIVNEVLGAFSLTTSSKCLEVNCDIDPLITIEGEASLTKSLISNIHKNALEAAPRGSSITLGCQLDKEKVTLAIHNQGLVADQIASRLFEKYSSYDKHNATGIGAYASKLMIEVQGGTLDFESTLLQGTTMKMTFVKKYVNKNASTYLSE